MNATELFIRHFAIVHNGRMVASCSAVDTCEGTKRQWSWLERKGYVEKNTRSGRGILGHTFSRKITPAGEAFIASLNAPKC